MNREQYLKELSKYIKKLPKADYEDTMSYFEECFDEVGEEGEASLIEELGSPQILASEILSKLLEGESFSENSIIIANKKEEHEETRNSKKSNFKSRKAQNKPSRFLLISLLAILAAPIGFPLSIAFLALVFSLFITAFSLVFAILMIFFASSLAAVKLFVIGFLSLFISPAASLMILGSALIIIAIGFLSLILIKYISQFLFKSIKKIISFMLNLIKKEER